MITLKFYEVDKPYGCFSNFAKYPIQIQGQEWKTSEHYFQACKFVNDKDKNEVFEAKTPFVAAQIGRDRSRVIHPNWDDIKDEVMLKALTAKFSQHADLRDILLSTGDCFLVEHTTNDTYWADGGDGSGTNRLGELLMKLRLELGGKQTNFFDPPWVKFPNYEVSDMFWRMGLGEGYLAESSRWRMALPEAARHEYDEYFKCPQPWLSSW